MLSAIHWCLSTAMSHGIAVPLSFRALMKFIVDEFALQNLILKHRTKFGGNKTVSKV
jgi:hypothetical protein